MIDMATFEQQTTVSRKFRFKIKQVDKKLKDYLKAVDDVINWRIQLPEIIRVGEALRDACTAYTRAGAEKGRLEGVNRVLRLVTFELSLLRLMLKARTEAGESGARAVIKCRDSTEKVFNVITSDEELTMHWMHPYLESLWDEISGVDKQGAGSKKDTTALGEQLINEDIGRLQTICNSGVTPGIVRVVLKQLLGPRVIGQLRPLIANSGASYNMFDAPDGGVKKKYVLKHPPDQQGGVRVRLGGLVHELTHIQTAEAFNCTCLLLSIHRDFTNAEIKAEAALRVAKITKLEIVLGDDTELATPRFRRLKSLMKNKCEYGRGLKLLTYCMNFKPTLVAEEGQVFYKRMTDLAGIDLVSSSMIEFDSVINQMLLWCHTHGVSLENRVYTMLKELAEEGMLRRLRAIPKPDLIRRVQAPPSQAF